MAKSAAKPTVRPNRHAQSAAKSTAQSNRHARRTKVPDSPRNPSEPARPGQMNRFGGTRLTRRPRIGGIVRTVRNRRQPTRSAAPVRSAPPAERSARPAVRSAPPQEPPARRNAPHPPPSRDARPAHPECPILENRTSEAARRYSECPILQNRTQKHRQARHEPACGRHATSRPASTPYQRPTRSDHIQNFRQDSQTRPRTAAHAVLP